MSTQIVEFNEWQAKISVLVEPTLTMAITTAQSAQYVTEALCAVKDYAREVDQVRKSLVGPLNDRVKFINEYAREIAGPLAQAEAHLKKQLVMYEDKLAAERRVEMARMEAERVKREAEMLEKQRIEREDAAKVPDAPDVWSDGAAEPVQAVAQVEIKHAEERAGLQADVAAATWDIRQNRVSNARKNWKCELVDISLVPENLQIRMLNEKAVIAMAKTGVTNIPGVRIWQETSITVGRNTYIPHARNRTGGDG